jgi:two-component system, NtrC family, nitrogen regulation response regulator NtrX
MKGKILIVEDYADWRDLLSGMLAREGHDVVGASTLEEAMRHLDEIRDLDLAILDIRLVETDESNEDGMRLLSEIHLDQSFTRVIMISGHGTMEKQRKAFREFKAFDFFRKEQFDSEEFRKAVREAVEESARDRRQARENEYIHGRRFEQWKKDNTA